MRKQSQNIIIGQRSEFNDATYCVVEYQLNALPNPPICMMIVSCPLDHAFRFIVPERNSEWKRVVTPEHGILITIHAIGLKMDCDREARNMTAAKQPRCNLYGVDTRYQRKHIRCSNGEVYQTQQEAATALGIDQGAVSRVLRGAARSAKGYKFTYVDERHATVGKTWIEDI